MTRKLLCAIALCACAASTPAGDEAGMVKAFTYYAQAYVRLDAAGRAASRQGGLFTHAIADDFTSIIRKAFDGKDARNMRRTIRESDPVRPIVLHVHDTYPEDIPTTTMPPTLLRRLPELPKELAYRIVGRALVVLDIRTSTIVDFIPDAIPKANR